MAAPAAVTPSATPTLHLGGVDELGERLRLELERCGRSGVPTSFLAVQLTDWTDASEDGLEFADRFVREHFTSGMRPSDNVYRFGYPGCYVLILAGTGVRGAEVVRERFARRVEYAAEKSVGTIDMFVDGPDADAPDLMSLAERVARRFRDQSKLALEGDCPVSVPPRGHPGSVSQLVARLPAEVSLAVRNDFALHVVAIRAEIHSAAIVGLLPRHLTEVGARLLRATDGVYAVAPDCAAIVMPSTGGEEAAMLAHRLVLEEQEQLRGSKPEEIIATILEQVVVPIE